MASANEVKTKMFCKIVFILNHSALLQQLIGN